MADEVKKGVVVEFDFAAMDGAELLYRTTEALMKEKTFDEKLVRQLVEKITVYDDRFVVEFKSGEKVEIDK